MQFRRIFLKRSGEGGKAERQRERARAHTPSPHNRPKRLLVNSPGVFVSVAKAPRVNMTKARRDDRSSEQQELFPAEVQHAGDAPPRDVASMKKEIAELQSGTTASLDRAIAAAEATTGIATHTSTQLKEQRQQMGRIDAEARGIDSTLQQTGHGLKHGLTWRGALTSPFRRNKPKAKGVGTAGNISPVYKDDYAQPAAAPSDGGVSPKKRGSLFKGRAAQKSPPPPVEAPKVPEHVPDGFEQQLDKLDGLLDGLNFQAKAMGAELKQQEEGVAVLEARVEPLRQETASQAKQIKRRFGVKG